MLPLLLASALLGNILGFMLGTVTIILFQKGPWRNKLVSILILPFAVYIDLLFGSRFILSLYKFNYRFCHKTGSRSCNIGRALLDFIVPDAVIIKR